MYAAGAIGTSADMQAEVMAVNSTRIWHQMLQRERNKSLPRGMGRPQQQRQQTPPCAVWQLMPQRPQMPELIQAFNESPDISTCTT